MARKSRKSGTESITISSNEMRVYNTALYVRLSVEDNGKVDNDSIDNQIELLKGYVQERPYLFCVEIFVDNGYTGTDFERPEFTRMMYMVKSGKIDCIVVKDLSRLGRNYIETGNFIEKICPFFNLRFIAVNDGFDNALEGSSGELSVKIQNIMNDLYAKDISKKSRSALKTKRLNGEYIGNYAPHGYLKSSLNKNKLVVDSKTAPVIQQIFEWRAEGYGYTKILHLLNEADIPSPGRYRFENGIITNNKKKEKGCFGIDVY